MIERAAQERESACVFLFTLLHTLFLVRLRLSSSSSSPGLRWGRGFEGVDGVRLKEGGEFEVGGGGGGGVGCLGGGWKVVEEDGRGVACCAETW